MKSRSVQEPVTQAVRGTRSATRAQNTRQKILDAAQYLIETGGFTRLTTRQIAEQADVAEGTIFKHFKRKEDLSLAVVLENSPRFREAISKKRAGHGSVRKNLENIALAAIQFSDKLIPLAAALFADANLLARHRQVLNETGRGPRDAFEMIASYVSDEQKLGRINREVAPLAVSALLLGPCFYWAFLRQGLGRNVVPMSDAEYAKRLVFTLMRGVSSSRHE